MARAEHPDTSHHSTDKPAPGGSVALLLQRFPHIQTLSLGLLLRDQPFRDLCEEYEVCTQACERLKEDMPGRALHREYVSLQLRLERELLQYLEEATTKPHL